MRNVIVGLAASLALLCGCVVEAGPPAGASTSPSITALALGPLAGDNQSMGFGVNDAGSVVGMSAGMGGQRAFYWSKITGLVQLTTSGATGAAYAIAGKPGNVQYAVGYEKSGGRMRAVIWVAPPSLPPVPLSDTGSLALGVNDAGTAVGSSGGVPVIWTRNGSSYTPAYFDPLPNQVEAYAEYFDWSRMSRYYHAARRFALQKHYPGSTALLSQQDDDLEMPSGEGLGAKHTDKSRKHIAGQPGRKR